MWYVLPYVIRKEFRQIFRNKALLPLIFLTPIIQLLVMPLAANYDVKAIQVYVSDADHSAASRRLLAQCTASQDLVVHQIHGPDEGLLDAIQSDRADVMISIPRGFQQKLYQGQRNTLYVGVHAINGIKGQLGAQYIQALVQDFAQQAPRPSVPYSPPPITYIRTQFLYNRLLSYPFLMVPGILVTLVTMVGVYLCSLNIVKEKEVGTIEQLNVTPLPKAAFILGKLIPFWLIGLVVFSIGLWGVARGVYGIVPVGSYGLIYAFLALYLVAVLGIGLLISTVSDTQQQAMSLAFFFMMLAMMMSGLFTPIESMPGWAQHLAYLNPVSHFIQLMRAVVLKGSRWGDLWPHFVYVGSFAVMVNVWAVWQYRKTQA